MGWVSVLDVFLVEGACACVSVDGSGSHLWRAENQNRDWVSGFSMPLSSPFMSRVRKVHFCSRFRVALLAYLQYCQAPYLSLGSLGASVLLFCPALLAEAGWVGACVDLLVPSSSLRPGLPSAPGVHLTSHACGTCLAPACLLQHGACVHLVQFPRSPLLLRGLCALVSSHCLPASSQGLCVLPAPQVRPLCYVGCVHCPSLWRLHLRAPGPPFGLQCCFRPRGLYALTQLPRAPPLCHVGWCTREVCTPPHSLVPQACHLFGVSSSWASDGLRRAVFSAASPSPALPTQDWACSLKGSFPMPDLSSTFPLLCPSGTVPAQTFSSFSLFMSPSSLTSFQGV